MFFWLPEELKNVSSRALDRKEVSNELCERMNKDENLSELICEIEDIISCYVEDNKDDYLVRLEERMTWL